MAARKIKYAVGLALVLALGIIPNPGQVEHSWEKLRIFAAVFGFFGCLLIIFVSKALGRLFIQKKEDYYGD